MSPEESMDQEIQQLKRRLQVIEESRLRNEQARLAGAIKSATKDLAFKNAAAQKAFTRTIEAEIRFDGSDGGFYADTPSGRVPLMSYVEQLAGDLPGLFAGSNEIIVGVEDIHPGADLAKIGQQLSSLAVSSGYGKIR